MVELFLLSTICGLLDGALIFTAVYEEQNVPFIQDDFDEDRAYR